VVTTIPVISNSAGAPPPNPPAANPAPSKSAQPAADQLTSPIPPPSGSKPVHTVIIRPEQSASAAAPPRPQPAAAAHPMPARQPAAKPAREARPVRENRPSRESERRVAGAGPLSIVPGSEGAARQRPEPREQTATVRSSEPMSLGSRRAEQAAPARGGYAVQVASQRSEAEAMASFRALQARYPQQLGSHHAVVRRADLGAKGVYYRALVGPFASAEQAASLCKSLKAAGGTCMVQRD